MCRLGAAFPVLPALRRVSRCAVTAPSHHRVAAIQNAKAVQHHLGQVHRAPVWQEQLEAAQMVQTDVCWPSKVNSPLNSCQQHTPPPMDLPQGAGFVQQVNSSGNSGGSNDSSSSTSSTACARQEEGKILVRRAEETKRASAMHGLSRTLADNMVVGVSAGFEKRMEMVGTGYRASTSSKELTLNVGYSKPRILAIPDGVQVKVEKNTTLIISSADKVQLGAYCAEIRRQRPPEPYKGKGIRYTGEVIKLKEGKGGGKKK